MRHSLSTPLGLVAIPFALSVTTAAIADTQTLELAPIQIESSRINTEQGNNSQVVTVITREQIEQQMSISSDSSQVLSSLLPAYSPNTQKLNNSSQTFRGRSVLYMIDGVPQSNPIREGSRSAHTIDLAMVERIEVIHGASAIHGLGATGGIINFITKSNRSDSLKQSINASITTPTSELDSDTLSHKLGYQAQGAKGNWDYLVGLTRETQGMYLDGNDDYVGAETLRGDMQGSDSYDVFAKVGYWFNDDQNLELQHNRYKLESNMDFRAVTGDRANGIATGSTKGRPEGKAHFNEVETTNLTYTDSDLAGMELNAQAFLQDFKGRYGASTSSSFQDPNTPETIYDQSQNESEKIGAKVSLTKDGLLDNRLKVITGLDVLQDTTSQKLILTDRTYVPETTYTNYAPFAQFELQATDRLILQAGARYEKAKLDVDTYQTVAANDNVTVNGGSPEFDETVYNAGAVFKLTPSVSLFANYSEGFGMPDVGRVLRGIDTPNQDVNTLLNLSPIVTDNYEAGVRVNQQNVDFEISYYESNSDLGSRLSEVNGLYTVNREKKEIKGVEASLGLALNEQHRLETGYSYIRGKSDRDGDGEVDTKLNGSELPPNRLRVAWTANWNNKLSTMLQANHSFSRSFEEDNLDFDGYTLVDASMGYQLPVGRLNVSVANVFDEDYFTYYSQASYANDNSYFKGRGRTLTVGYGVDF
ncbi:TonB-dependent receptor [Marinomonas ostreistagni]|uniref:TonB-dependent receptor n=1 Tax=Marinomonas ostreistagni TaxID=359209 RepID=UPI00194F3459|nr:TonB-dependent receptor [Marinomonas ostreistagni]MBM6550789.1 TonB-dependent receptor [Marinomonas ostreistagni]